MFALLFKNNFVFLSKLNSIIMAQSNFNVGDIVTLKSGGPKMTINEIITKTISLFGEAPSQLEVNKIKVQWFNDKSEVVKAEFTEPQLEIAK
ncbi:TPA: DUF2158 domain-containing protein [Elizabethkingia anophelis]